MDQIKKSVIQIASLESNNDKAVKIKDTNNLSYTVWKMKQDWEKTKAWASLETVQWFGVGQKFAVSFKEESKVYMNRPYIARTIIIMDKVDDSAQVQSAPAMAATSAPQQQSFSQPKRSGQDENAEGKVRHGFALEAYKLGLELDGSTKSQIDRWVKYVLTWELPNPVVENIVNTFGWEDVTDDIMVEDIPF